MELTTIYTVEGNKFGKIIEEWAEKQNIEVISMSYKGDEITEIPESAILFHENFSISREDDEIMKEFAKINKLTHKFDLNGTFAATTSNFKMWLDRTQSKKVLFLGESKLAGHPTLERFLETVGK